MGLSGNAGSAQGSPQGIQGFRQAHYWLIIPLLITLLGFAPSYFLRFGEASWHQHLHGLSASLWFLLLIAQPYFATHGQLARHRLLGPIGLVLAGMVVASALAVIPANIENAQRADLPSIVPAAFFYGVSFFDLVLSIGFGTTVIFAMLNIRRPRDHAIWMISTVFWALSPGLARLAAQAMRVTVGSGGWTFIDVVMVTTLPIAAVVGLLMYRLRQAHPALLFVLAGNLTALLIAWLGDNRGWRDFADALFL